MSSALQDLADGFARLLAIARPPSPAPAPASPAPAAAAAAGGTATPADAAAGSAPPAPAPAPPPPPGPIQFVDFAARGFHLDVRVPSAKVAPAASLLDAQGFTLDAITGVDWMAEDEMEVVYDYFHPTAGVRVAVRTRVPRSDPRLPTISTIYPGANWHERETHEFFGIVFTGHPNLVPLLLPEDATYHPLRKDFTA